MDKLTITSPAFRQSASIPEKYTCDGTDVNPPLEVANIPQGAKSLAIIAEDPDAVSGVFDHWVAWNLQPRENIDQNPSGIHGKNSTGANGYSGPCPPSGTHRYFFKVFALDTVLNISESSGKQELLRAMEGHILGAGELMGLYKRKGQK